MIKCPCCKREWPEDCEQAVCIERFDECCVCRFTPQGCGSLSGTRRELEEMAIEAKRRATKSP